MRALPYQSVGQQDTHTTTEECAMSDFRLLISGKLAEGAGALDLINPATGRTLAVAPRADRDQLEQAGPAANAAFPPWHATPRRQRAALPVKLADALVASEHHAARH